MGDVLARLMRWMETAQDQEHRNMDTENTSDDKAMPPAFAGSHGEHEQALFSQRSSMANAALRWCDEIGVLPVAFNVVTALFRLGLVQKPQPQPTLTDEEREAIEKAIGRELDAEWYGGKEPDRVVALRGLLERTK